MKQLFASTLLVAGLSLGMTIGCSDDPIETITNTITCRDVCTSYSDCIDADYDVSACADRCESEASGSEDKERRLNLCQNCINERSCTGAVLNCPTECAGIVP